MELKMKWNHPLHLKEKQKRKKMPIISENSSLAPSLTATVATNTYSLTLHSQFTYFQSIEQVPASHCLHSITEALFPTYTPILVKWYHVTPFWDDCQQFLLNFTFWLRKNWTVIPDKWVVPYKAWIDRTSSIKLGPPKACSHCKSQWQACDFPGKQWNKTPCLFLWQKVTIIRATGTLAPHPFCQT